MKLCRTLFACALFTTAFAAAAGEIRPYTEADFSALRGAGKPVLVDVHASWCPTCAQQKPIIESLSRDPAFAELTVLQVDFDAQKPVVRALRASSQSTLIAYHGEREVARSVGDTSPAGIRALLAKTLTP
ncbi:thioredoxin family protein [Plasticicumulans acidivorans]|uniref:Thioredoxin n=1 Tax=Plasticicumulans acidivorans TaxID=886464 RepID=A0A317N0Y7_9GAMM|nr:thioredoxin family protein [Plasticicumulans acidivorans]PWV65588.1 thioredoxin [Plasticicumulans acidivorans]